MIQRIQSLFLFAALCFLVPMFFMPLAELHFSTGSILTFDLSSDISIMVFGILICALNFVAIFMYKRRVLQMRLCIYNIILLIGMTGVVLYVLYGIKDVESVQYRLPFVFPIIAVILHYLAFRGIRKDELMVQAMSRLR